MNVTRSEGSTGTFSCCGTCMLSYFSLNLVVFGVWYVARVLWYLSELALWYLSAEGDIQTSDSGKVSTNSNTLINALISLPLISYDHLTFKRNLKLLPVVCATCPVRVRPLPCETKLKRQQEEEGGRNNCFSNVIPHAATGCPEERADMTVKW